MNFTFKGFMAPAFTPFKDNEKRSLDLSMIPKYRSYLSNKGIKGVLVNGTTGEGMSMSAAERMQVAECWLTRDNSDQHIMIQVGGAPFPDVIDMARHAEKLGADSILCLPELYSKPQDMAELISYLSIVGQAAPNTPLLYYHIPMFTNVNMHMGKFLTEIAGKVPTFVGIKFTSNDLSEGMEAVRANNRQFRVFLGADTLILGAYALGFDSAIATTFNIVPNVGHAIIKYYSEGNREAAQKEQEKLSGIVNGITRYGTWVPSMKEAMNIFTPINCGPVRSPLKPLFLQEAKSLQKDVGIFISHKLKKDTDQIKKTTYCITDLTHLL